MSKKSKAKNRDKRIAKKRAIKMANRAKYDSWKKEGKNTKSKRSRSNTRKNRLAKTFDHAPGNCGNIGCKKCYPVKLAA